MSQIKLETRYITMLLLEMIHYCDNLPINAWGLKIYLHSRFIQSDENSFHSNIRSQQCAMFVGCNNLAKSEH